MKFSTFLASAVVAGSLATIGCDEKPTPAPTPTPTAESTTADKVNAAAGDLRDKVTGAQKDAGAAAAKTGEKAQEAGNEMIAQAQKLYADASAAISSAKWDDAQKYVDQLKALRDKLPAEWQTKVDALVTQFTDAKSKLGGMSMPAMPK